MKTRDELLKVGMFPILLGGDIRNEGRVCVPLALVSPHERQAVRNHSQSLWTLASRGGLSPRELAAVLADSEQMPSTDEEAWRAIFAAASALQSNA